MPSRRPRRRHHLPPPRPRRALAFGELTPAQRYEWVDHILSDHLVPILNSGRKPGPVPLTGETEGRHTTT